jgi:hypothetical protein
MKLNMHLLVNLLKQSECVFDEENSRNFFFFFYLNHFILFLRITLVRKDANQVELKSESKIKVILNSKPFKLELFSNDVLIALINSKNLLKFEHLRTRE